MMDKPEFTSLFQNIARNHPTRGDDIRSISSALRNVEDTLHERGIDICHESVRLWIDRICPIFAGKFRTRQASYMRQHKQWQWHFNEVFVKINGVQNYLWRAVDYEGEALESYVTKTRDKPAALRFLKKAMKRYGSPRTVITDRLRSYGAAMKEIRMIDRQEAVAISTIEPRIATSPSGEENGRCRGSSECQTFRNSLRPTPRSTIT